MILPKIKKSFKTIVGYGSDKGGTKVSRRPANTSFRQQRLKAWNPILSPQNVLPLLILLACILAPIGIGLIISVISVQDTIIEYTNCSSESTTTSFTQIPDKYIKYHFKQKLNMEPMWRSFVNTDSDETICQLRFEIPNDVKTPINVYYKLTNFYQNHREYVDSIDIDQLKGEAIPYSDLDDKCDPFREYNGKTVYPCGLIANSMFNDTFASEFVGIDDTRNYKLTNNNTAWSTDKHRYKKTKYDINDIVPPVNWIKKFPNGYTEENLPDLNTWQEFQVWARPAALPNFYKLILKNETVTLPTGNYTFDIGLNYPVDSFDGTKSFVLTTNTIVGARNITLGVVYLIVAGISTLFAFIFLIKVLLSPKENSDHLYLRNAHLTGRNGTRPELPIREIL
ncbi:hypothetical protein TPHA_0M02100 [Tetrapisispora phaffii CBS 4417]|uniref:Cell division control protein 50 n=1 Tax=Tetrapisispora phaffii (strain ATCC 24235 / CBS 4417 / NBRC 1672 / NRRL Y-8282 / UCD 70-5) TaxID=1071381 RepID=G8C0R9_TETPH|nr:hypothetical protein TPHA_0M02100 [Tetrapisispora phaffii CBS 4417]CCE65784.1 hypothetical protein TPHA_0M02100 [Tetrapisispora phaffii CBS 4417]